MLIRSLLIVPFFVLAMSAAICDAQDKNIPVPQMVKLPGGTFLMGLPEDETDAPDFDDPARPQHKVTISPFAIGKYEVTFEEWDACAADGGCNGYRPADDNWGRGRRPVIYVSWFDAKEYVEWLARKTGKPFRLPTEAEWE